MRKITIEDYKRSYIAQDLLDELFNRNWFKLFVPEAYGGLESDLKSACKHITETASHFGGLGWVLNLGAGANWFSGCFDPDAANRIFSPHRTVIAGSGASSGSFELKRSSVILNGSWGKCSGARHANYFSLNAKNKHTGELSSFVVPRESVEFSKEKWEIFGLKSTSSLSIDLIDVEVPKDFGFQINFIKNNSGYKVFHIPFETFARFCMASCFIGIAQCFLNAIQSDKKTLDKNFEALINSLQNAISKAIQYRDNLAEKVQDKSDQGRLDPQIQEDLKSKLGKSNLLIFDHIQEIFKKGGLSLVEEDQLSHWAYRDVLTAIQHPMMRY